MGRGIRRAAAAGLICLAIAACGDKQDGQPAVRLVPPAAQQPAFVEVSGLSDDVRRALTGDAVSPKVWASVLRVAVDEDGPPVVGTYLLAGHTVRFTPAYPFDPGRPYHVRFDPAALSGVGLAQPLATVVSLPGPPSAPATRVTAVYPSASVVPENLLRLYIEFSGPMGRRPVADHLRLLDDRGEAVEGAFLPLDYEFWNADRTRLTVFFDPGRVKEGILPNAELGRPLRAGRTYTLAIDRGWRDGNGVPLQDGFRHQLRVGAADVEPIEPSRWKVTAPPAANRDPLMVEFAEPLDRGLMLRALGVRRGTASVPGDVTVDLHETRWRFTPRDPWQSGRYDLIALESLEDVAGNQIGRAFEVDAANQVDRQAAQTFTVPFTIR